MFSTWNVVPRNLTATVVRRGEEGWDLGDCSLTNKFSFSPDIAGAHLDTVLLFVGQHNPLERLDIRSLSFDPSVGIPRAVLSSGGRC